MVTRAHWDGDALAASIALGEAFRKLGKQVDVACAAFDPHEARALSFLPNLDAILPHLQTKTNAVITLNLADHDGLESLSYRMDDRTLSLYITPNHGELRREHVVDVTSTYTYDLIIVVGSPTLEQLAHVFEDQRTLFFATPLVVIDHRAENEHFGAINIVDITAASTSEVVFSVIESLDEKILDAELATTLLAGMVVATKSFMLENLPPKTFARAGQLVSLGADRDRIMRHLHRQKTVPQLKLWGRALQNLQHEQDIKLVWTTLAAADFSETKTTESDIGLLMDDLLSSTPDAELALLVCERAEGAIRHCLRTTRHLPVAQLVEPFHPTNRGSHRVCTFDTTHTSPQTAAADVIAHLRSRLPQLIRR